MVSEPIKGAAWSFGGLQWPRSIYGDTASAEGRAFTLLAFSGAVQSCCEGSCQGSEFVFIQDIPPPPTVNQSCQCGSLRIVTKFERRTAMPYRAQFGLCMPPEAPLLRHTIHTAPPTTFSDQACQPSLGLPRLLLSPNIDI